MPPPPPKKISTKFRTLKNIHFSENSINIKITKFEPKKWPSLRMYETIREPPMVHYIAYSTFVFEHRHSMLAQMDSHVTYMRLFTVI